MYYHEMQIANIQEACGVRFEHKTARNNISRRECFQLEFTRLKRLCYLAEKPAKGILSASYRRLLNIR